MVLNEAGGNSNSILSLLWNSLAASNLNRQHMPPFSIARRVPMDVPRGQSFLQRLPHFGCGWAPPHVWPPWSIRQDELLLPPRHSCTSASVAPLSPFSWEKMDKTYQHAHYHRGGWGLCQLPRQWTTGAGVLWGFFSTFLCTGDSRGGGLGTTTFYQLGWMLEWLSWPYSPISHCRIKTSMGCSGGVWV